MLETLDYTIRIGSIPTFLYFDLYLYSAYAAHFVYIYIYIYINRYIQIYIYILIIIFCIYTRCQSMKVNIMGWKFVCR